MRTYRYFKSPKSNDFAFVSAVLRLSTKYVVETLRTRCLARLELDWPTTLGGWDLREREALDSKGRYLPREVCCHPILLMEVAIELNAHHLLPSAFYDLSRYGPSKIMAGTTCPALALDVAAAKPKLTHKMDSDENQPGAIGGGAGDGGRSGNWGHGQAEASRERVAALSKEMLIRTFKGREAAQRYVSDFVSKELEHRLPCADCLSRLSDNLSNTPELEDTPTSIPNLNSANATTSHPPHSVNAANAHASRNCLESFYFIMLNILRSVGGIACGRDADPLFTLVQATEMLTRTDFSDGQRQTGLRMCQACKVDFAKSVGRAREEVWSLLPIWFGLQESLERNARSGSGKDGAKDRVIGG